MKYSEFEKSIAVLGSDDYIKVIDYPFYIQYVKEQTPELCLVAVNHDGWALQYVKEQTPEICLAAVRRDGRALRYVDRSIFESDD